MTFIQVLHKMQENAYQVRWFRFENLLQSQHHVSLPVVFFHKMHQSPFLQGLRPNLAGEFTTLPGLYRVGQIK